MPEAQFQTFLIQVLYTLTSNRRQYNYYNLKYRPIIERIQPFNVPYTYPYLRNKTSFNKGDAH